MNLWKNIILIATIAIVCFLGGTWYAQRSESPRAVAGGRRVLRYICPMHPQYTSDKPGTAPCCGMRLEPVYEDDAAAGGQAVSYPPGTVRITPELQQTIGVRSAGIEKMQGAQSVRTLGRVAPDERLIYRVNAGLDGWVRETYDDSTGSIVKKDQRLATIYSPMFRNAQQAYLTALGHLETAREHLKDQPAQLASVENSYLIYRDSLKNLGMGDPQLEEIGREKQYTENVHLYSPATGFVLTRNVSVGQKFLNGQELYVIADLSRVWILADLFEYESRFARAGQTVKVLYQDRTYHAKVSEVLPQFDPVSRTFKVRLEMENPGYVFRPDMFVDVELPVNLPESLAVPAGAVIDTGLRKIVFVDRGNGYFEPRRVETGWRLGDRIQITKGLMEGERIVVSGNFLVDSESRLKLAAAGLPEDYVIDPVCGMGVDPKRSQLKSVHGGQTYYFCNPDCKAKFEAGPERYLGKNSEVRSQKSEAKMRKEEGKVAEQTEKRTARDPVCGMDVDTSGPGAIKAEYQGKTYYFCNPSCKESFQKDPGKYAAK